MSESGEFEMSSDMRVRPAALDVRNTGYGPAGEGSTVVRLSPRQVAWLLRRADDVPASLSGAGAGIRHAALRAMSRTHG